MVCDFDDNVAATATLCFHFAGTTVHSHPFCCVMSQHVVVCPYHTAINARQTAVLPASLCVQFALSAHIWFQSRFTRDQAHVCPTPTRGKVMVPAAARLGVKSHPCPPFARPLTPRQPRPARPVLPPVAIHQGAVPDRMVTRPAVHQRLRPAPVLRGRRRARAAGRPAPRRRRDPRDPRDGDPR